MKTAPNSSPFGSVQGQQGGRVDVFGHGVLVGDEGYILQEFIQGARDVFLREAAQFAHVLPTLGAFFAAIVEIFLVADVGGDAVEKFCDGVRSGRRLSSLRA